MANYRAEQGVSMSETISAFGNDKQHGAARRCVWACWCVDRLIGICPHRLSTQQGCEENRERGVFPRPRTRSDAARDRVVIDPLGQDGALESGR